MMTTPTLIKDVTIPISAFHDEQTVNGCLSKDNFLQVNTLCI